MQGRTTLGVLAAATALSLVAACGGGGSPVRAAATTSRRPGTTSTTTGATTTTSAPTTPAPTTPAPPPSATTSSPAGTAGPAPATAPRPAPATGPAPAPAPGPAPGTWQGVAMTGGPQVAARMTMNVGGADVTLVRLSPGVQLHLITGSGAVPQGANLAVAFNGAFQYGAESGVKLPGQAPQGAFNAGMAAVVGRYDGSVRVGVLGRDFGHLDPAVAWARSNLVPLIDGGQVAGNAGNPAAWGAPFNGYYTARSAIGSDANGSLYYAASMASYPVQIAQAMQSVGVLEAMTLDMNAWWVGAYAFADGHPWALLNNPNHGGWFLGSTYQGSPRDYFLATYG